MALTRVRPERRGRGDIVVAVALAVALVGGATVLWRTSALAGTVATPAAAPIVSAPRVATAPAGLVEVWRAASAATPSPVLAGPAVVTGGGSTVVGRDAVTGTVGWSYVRDRALCTVGTGFPGVEEGAGRVLALYAGTSGYCSELTALRPDNGERALHPTTGVRSSGRSPDVRPGTRLIGDPTFVVATGPDYLEVLRSDLVRTLEYGRVTTPVQVNQQPRTGCTYGSTTMGGGHVGVVERCPGEATDRLTVLKPDPSDARKPEEKFSVLLPAAGATVIALSTERAAVALPGPPRLLLLDGTGQQVGLLPLDVPEADLAADPPGGATPTESDGARIHWWTGSRSVALDATGLAPLWIVDGALGPAVQYGDELLVPVPDGLLVVDAASGTAVRVLPVTRDDRAAPVRLAAAGEVLLEQRGAELVALRPAP